MLEHLLLLTRALRLVEHDHHLTKDDKRLIKALIEGYAMPVPEKNEQCGHQGPIVPYPLRQSSHCKNYTTH